MKDLYLVDGYNVIFGRPDIFDRSDLESCRKKLMDIMQDYGAHNDIEVIIAFDGKGNSTKVKVEELSAFFTIVYTPRRMTADSYIEKESYSYDTDFLENKSKSDCSYGHYLGSFKTKNA